MSKRISVTLPDGLAALIEAIDTASKSTEDLPPLSQARVLRLLATAGADQLVEGTIDVHGRDLADEVDGETLAEFIPDHVKGKYLREQVKDENWLPNIRGGFEDRVRTEFEKRFGNDYSPEDIEAVAEGFIKEAHVLWVLLGDDRETFEAKREWIQERIDVYRQKHEQTSYDPDAEFLAGWSGVEEAEETDEFAEVEGMVRAVAEDRYRTGTPSARALTAHLAHVFEADEGRVAQVVDDVRRNRVVEDQTREADDGHDALDGDARAALAAHNGGSIEDAVEALSVHGRRAPDCHREEVALDGVVLDESEAADLVDLDVGEVETDGGNDEVDEGDGPRTDGGVDRQRTRRSPGQEGYWNELAESAEEARDHAADGGEHDDRVTVRERIAEELDGRIHGIAVTARRGETFYAVVSHDASGRGGDVVRLTTVVVDLSDGKVKASGNGMWVPREADTLDALTRVVARSTSDVAANDGKTPPVETGVNEVDVDEVLSTNLAADEYQPEHGEWGIKWGNGKGEPDEAHDLTERLAEAGVETARFSRLQYGKKQPYNRVADLAASDLFGNYGVETLPGDPLIVIDVDYPEDAPLAELPSTYRVSSPNGGDDRAHHYYTVDDVDAVREHFGTGAIKPGWGDVWVDGEYVVGPGCYLKEVGEFYRVVEDVPIREVSAEFLIDLLDVEDEDEERDEDDDAQVVTHPNDEDDDEDDDGRTVECHDCDADVDSDDASLVDRDGTPAYVCEECR